MDASLGYRTGINNPLMSKQLVILLISQSLLARYDEKQLEAVVKRHLRGAWISPILVRSCDWIYHPFISEDEFVLHPRIGRTQLEEGKNFVGRVKAFIDITFIVKTGDDAIEPCASGKLHKCSSSFWHHLIEANRGQTADQSVTRRIGSMAGDCDRRKQVGRDL